MLPAYSEWPGPQNLGPPGEWLTAQVLPCWRPAMPGSVAAAASASTGKLPGERRTRRLSAFGSQASGTLVAGLHFGNTLVHAGPFLELIN